MIPLKPKISRKKWDKMYKKGTFIFWSLIILFLLIMIGLLSSYSFEWMDYSSNNTVFLLIFYLCVLFTICALIFGFWLQFKENWKRGPYYYLFEGSMSNPIDGKNCPVFVVWDNEHPIIFIMIRQANVLYIVQYFANRFF